MSDAHIRRAQEAEHAALVMLWERSVRATEALGFAVVGRSPVDDMGRPFPLLHMRRETPQGEGA